MNEPKTATATRTRKTAEQRKHEHFLNLARLLRAGRLHRVEMTECHAEHTFENGEHVDFYESSRYAGFAYMVVSTDHGYECGCESFEHRHHCGHCLDSSARAAARYREAKRQNELDAAALVASLIVGEQFAQDLAAHIDDELASQDDEPTMEAIAAEIIEDELVQAEVAALPDADGDAMAEIDAMQAEKKRKMAASVDERMSRAPMTSNDGFSLMMPEKPRRKSRSAA